MMREVKIEGKDYFIEDCKRCRKSFYINVGDENLAFCSTECSQKFIFESIERIHEGLGDQYRRHERLTEKYCDLNGRLTFLTIFGAFGFVFGGAALILFSIHF